MKSLTKYKRPRTIVFTAALIGLLLIISPIVHAAQSSDYVIKQSVLSTDSDPSGDGSIFGTLGYPSINANGAITFSAYDYTSTRDSAIYSTANGVAVGPLARIVGRGDIAPGILGEFGNFDGVSLNDNGSFAFRGLGTDSSNRGIYFYSVTGKIELIADAKTQRPNHNDTFINSQGFRYPLASDGGYVAFSYNRTYEYDRGVFLADIDSSNDTLTLMELVDLDLFYKSLGCSYGTTPGSPSGYALNDAGVVAMTLRCDKQNPYEHNTFIYTANPDGILSLVVKNGDSVPDGRYITVIGGSPSINTEGNIAFLGYLESPDNGIFVVDKEGKITKIIDNSAAVPNHPEVTFSYYGDIHLADNGTIVFTGRYVLDGLYYQGIYMISDAVLEVIFDQFDGIKVNSENVSLVVEADEGSGQKVLGLNLASRFVNDRLDVAFKQSLPADEGAYYKSGIFVAERVVSYTPEGLTDLINNLPADALAEELVNSLTQKVSNADKQAGKDNICAAVNVLEAFQNAVEAQRDNKITDVTASLLIEYSSALITQALESLPEAETCKP